MAQAGSSFEKKVTPEQFCPYPGAAPNVSGNGGWVRKKSRIPTLHLRRNMFRTLLPWEGEVGFSIQNAERKSKRVTKLYETDSDISDSYFTTHETNKFAEKDGCEGDMDCLTQPLGPHYFVLVKLAMKNTVKYFVGLIQEVVPDGYSIHFQKKHVGHFVFQRLKTLQ